MNKFPVSMYFVMVFIISWSGVLVIAFSTGIPASPDDTTRYFPITLITMLAGPTLTGLLLTGLMFGKEGFKNLLFKFTTWRLGIQWYAVAILTVPIVVGSILWILSQSWSSIYLPQIVTADDKRGLLIYALGVGLAAGFFEEIGWTGFAIPQLLKKHSVVITGLIVGLLWGSWHFLVTIWASGNSPGVISRDLLIPPIAFYAGVLPAYRVLMVWVYDRTESLLMSMLMHASLTTCTISLLLPPATGIPLIKYYLILTIALWAITANLLTSRASIFQKRIAKTL